LDLHFDLVAGAFFDAPKFVSDGKKLSVKLEQHLVITFLAQRMVEAAARKGGFAGWVGDVAAPGEAGEFFTSAFLDGGE
jgi:hypothetical protein